MKRRDFIISSMASFLIPLIPSIALAKDTMDGITDDPKIYLDFINKDMPLNNLHIMNDYCSSRFRWMMVSFNATFNDNIISARTRALRTEYTIENDWNFVKSGIIDETEREISRLNNLDLDMAIFGFSSFSAISHDTFIPYTGFKIRYAVIPRNIIRV